MLKRSLHELSIATLFNCVDVKTCLHDYIKNKQQHIGTLLPTCREKLGPAFERAHPRQFRLPDIERVFTSIWDEKLFSGPDIPLLDSLFGRLMLRNGDHLQYREDQVQAYARFAVDLDPTLLVGWHLAGRLYQAEPLGKYDLQRIVNNQYSFFSPAASHEKAYAEGHVHWGGIGFDGAFLASNITATDGEEHNDRYAHLRHILKVIISHADRGKNELDTNLASALGNISYSKTLPSLDWHSIRDGCILTESIDSSWLRFMLANSVIKKKYAVAWSWLVCLLWHSYRSPKTPSKLRIAIFYLFMELTCIRKTAIMNGQGLSAFLGTSKLGELDAHTVEENRRRILPGAEDVAEIKLSTTAFNAARLVELASASPTWKRLDTTRKAPHRNPGARQREHIRQLERTHFCLHFIRSKRNTNKCTDKIREKLWKQAQELADIFNKDEKWTAPDYLGDFSQPAYKFQPSRWIRGLDVAGDENVQRIEQHAPILRWLRRGLSNAVNATVITPGPHLSIHAGEDYAHPLSGLRHIDETVRFCEMRSGDRLGHALALGLEPAAWVDKHGDMLLPAEEHLDNLVWAWHYAGELSHCLPLASQVRPRLEKRIARMLAHVPWVSQRENQVLLSSVSTGNAQPEALLSNIHPSLDILFQAWELRRNCHQMYKAGDYLQDSKTRSAVPDFDRLHAVARKLQTGTAEWLYFEREAYLNKTKSAPQCTVLIRPLSAQEEYIRNDKTPDGAVLMHDYETIEELQFIHALQDYLMNRYDRLGLLIETNPTSNVFIARMEKHADHPIFRWSPPDGGSLERGEAYNLHGLRKGPMRVLINTDDPGIMPTTLRTEYALLLEAAVDLGYSRATTETWLEQIRLLGLEQFRRNHLPVFMNMDGEAL
ncbi:antiviral RADAR system adenosine deaminase RdrB [Janthinobacterium sp. NKUCC08_JDC]|uniref:antiviral RADAR system adenosine deaminase RdrB n=1 Tax=Janthinobacterium sp. NKUCC08_JDC TaxID=2842122 RepID=UPI001C5B3255|nr:antiviral RADAR system adenosine deaminase RdrB [Janthinobacterium sp. NKUCC08_JDC]MBW3497191.1 hypothetical protein [Janthinobacterium sp. NKUCC08_JDC]